MAEVAIAHGRYLKMSARKSRLVGDMIRGKDAGEALTILRFSKKKKAADMVAKVLNSAIANAQVRFPNIDVDALFVDRICIDQAPGMKRFRTAPRGRGVRIKKHYCHVSIHLGEREEK